MSRSPVSLWHRVSALEIGQEVFFGGTALVRSDRRHGPPPLRPTSSPCPQSSRAEECCLDAQLKWSDTLPESSGVPRLQYGLAGRAQALGWAAERVLVIDEDLGKSGASAEGRAGFQRLVTEVSLDHVGIIFGVEMSPWPAPTKTGISC